MITYMLLAVAVIFLGVMLNKVSVKFGIPVLLAFIAMGMIFGTDGIGHISFDNFDFAEQISTVSLVIIMFYGGFGTSWKHAKPAAVQSILLSTAGVLITTALVGLFCHFVFHMSWIMGFLIGSVISSTDAASVFSILRSRHLNLKYNTASLLEMESGSNDPMAFMLTVIFASVANGEATKESVIKVVISQPVLGILAGAIVGLGAAYIMKKIKFSAGYDMVFLMGVILFSYAAPSIFNGSGYLSTYIAGIILGNSDIKGKKSLVNFLDGMTGLAQMLIFFLFGLLATPSMIPQYVVTALPLALFLIFIARPLSVFLLLLPFGSKPERCALISFAGLRGAASIVFAIFAVLHTGNDDIFHGTFVIVLISILFQGTLLPAVSRKLNMIDDREDVMKTFTDYSEEERVQFIQFTIPPKHPWTGHRIQDIVLPPDTLLVLSESESHISVPNGNTCIREGDRLILSAAEPAYVEGIKLTEIAITEESEYVNMTLAELNMPENSLIIMIKRGEDIIIPQGNVKLLSGDVLVINHID